MNRSLLALVAAAAALPAAADVQTQQAEFLWDVQAANEPVALEFAAFDDMGGSRVLTGVNVSFESIYSLNLLAENGEDFAITSDQWFVEALTLMQIDIGGLFLGALDVEGFGLLSADLAANDGVSMEGPDSVFWGFKGEMSGGVDIDPLDFGVFRGGETISADLYPFLSLSIPFPPPFFDLYVTDHFHLGTATVTYEYVPAPATLAPLALVGLGAARRRR